VGISGVWVHGGACDVLGGIKFLDREYKRPLWRRRRMTKNINMRLHMGHTKNGGKFGGKFILVKVKLV